MILQQADISLGKIQLSYSYKATIYFGNSSPVAQANGNAINMT